VRVDRRYNQPFRLTGYAWRVILKWFGLVVIWLALGSASGWLGLFGAVALGSYAIHCLRNDARLRNQVTATPARAAMGMPAKPAAQAAAHSLRFNPPPGWPTAPAGWTPPAGWQPDLSWPPAPPGWQLWVHTTAPAGERNTRTIPQDVKIHVAHRDGGRCRQCGSDQDLHYDHMIPWSKGGANTINNIQLLCGYHNRLKGADDFPL
jgi:hypothetical protein